MIELHVLARARRRADRECGGDHESIVGTHVSATLFDGAQKSIKLPVSAQAGAPKSGAQGVYLFEQVEHQGGARCAQFQI